MKNVGIAAILLGIVVSILALSGVLGGASPRTTLLAAVVILAAGLFLYRRGVRRPTP